MIALCIIIFTGGMETRFSEIRPVIGPGVVLATVGVVLTAFVLSPVSVYLVAPGSTVASPSRWRCAAGLDDGFDRLGVGLLSILRTQSQGAASEPAASAGAGERFE